ncbi:MAG: hypothetical protein HOP12_15130 [Candidatus Eisenbacteria bacterium]|uniref:DUF5666 domain-containing protein n=1 Tax=Eiseniibacteriota bacterium TaxID=2212470 RepID=A0A849SR75_UNCEI|nr:hypothetical protein [Candidatus Eisenbacteria bacterium]
MKSKRIWIPVGLAAALVFGALAPAGGLAPAAYAKAEATASSTAKKKVVQRQFTGYVVAMEKASFTVEKRGKKAETRVFSRNAELKTTGELQKDAYVTVYYRDKDGQAVAHKVVVKEPSNT